MSKFNFKYDSIKKVKDILEKKVQKEIAFIDMEIDKNIYEREKLILEAEENIKNRKSNRVSELKAIENFKRSIEKKIEIIEKQIVALEKQKEEKMKELIEKSKENKIFQTLEEAHLEDFKHEENLKDEGKINEIATQKFIRNKG
jgi:flagellar export protein FliJ